MISSFGSTIKRLRESKHLLQRQVANELSIDSPMLSKIERGDRKAKREQVLVFAKLYNANREELLSLWLAEQVMDTIKGEDLAQQAIDLVSQRIKKSR